MLLKYNPQPSAVLNINAKCREINVKCESHKNETALFHPYSDEKIINGLRVVKGKKNQNFEDKKSVSRK